MEWPSTATTAASVRGSHVLLAIGSVPNSDHLGLETAGVEVDKWGYIPINHHCETNVAHIYAAGDVSGKLPLSSVAAMQGRKVAEHIMGLHTLEHRHIDYDKAASAIFTEPEIADVGLAEAEAFANRPKNPGNQGALRCLGPGAHKRRPPGVRQNNLRPRHRRRPRRMRRR